MYKIQIKMAFNTLNRYYDDSLFGPPTREEYIEKGHMLVNRLRSLRINILDQYSVDYHECFDIDTSRGTCPAMDVRTKYGELIFYIPLNVEKELLSKDIVNKELGKNFRMNLKEQDEYIDIREKEGGFFGDSWFPDDMERLIEESSEPFFDISDLQYTPYAEKGFVFETITE